MYRMGCHWIFWPMLLACITELTLSKKVIPEEYRLLKDLYSSGYTKNARPVKNSTEPIKVTFGLKLGQLVRVNNKRQSMTTIVWVTQRWRNPFLRWKTADYEGLDTIHIPPEDIWVPDTVLYNNADEGTAMAGYLTKFQTKVMVKNNGVCMWMAPATFTSTCEINVKYWPFDTQNCMMIFGSWSYEQKFLEYRTGEANTLETVSTKLADDFLTNGDWTVQKIKNKRNAKLYSCCSTDYSDTTITITLERKPLYHMVHLVIPIGILAVLTLVNFAIPSESGERIGYVMTLLLAMSVYLLLLGDTLPETSDVIPLLEIFVIMTMTTIFLNLLATVIVLKCFHKNGSPPPWIIVLLTMVYYKKSVKHIARVEPEKIETDLKLIDESVSRDIVSVDRENKEKEEEEPNMTWQDVSVYLDRVFFTLFLIVPLSIYIALGIIAFTENV